MSRERHRQWIGRTSAHWKSLIEAAAAVALSAALVSCGSGVASPSALSAPPVASGSATVSPAPSDQPTIGNVEPAPGSDSAVYAPNPGAIVVAIDAGHGGCLDWGVPDPSERGVELAEKTMTLAMARALRDRLEADGIGVVMVRDGDEALAGDNYPQLGCDGPAWRDVNGDGEAGFDPEGATRTRDELQARLDLANLSAADAFVSIHVNSPFDGGQRIEIAFTATFYTDETPWGATATETLARGIQSGVTGSLARVASYERGDRGITAHNFYLVAPTLFEPTPDRPDPLRQPTRGALMPTALAEVGSITLRAEHDLLSSAAGHAAVADGLQAGLTAFFAGRDLAVRIGLEGASFAAPVAVQGDGPPFWSPRAPESPFRVRVINTGTNAIDAGAALIGGWGASDQPYLAAPPDGVGPISEPLPALRPGESVVVEAVLPEAPPGTRGVAWISLQVGGTMLSDLGVPALQLASEAP